MGKATPDPGDQRHPLPGGVVRGILGLPPAGASVMRRPRRLLPLALVLVLPLALGGQQVTPQASGVRTLLQAVSAVDGDVVWVSGHGGTVLRTIDGGTRWERRVVPGADSLEFRDIEARDARTAWVLSAGPGARSTIHRTSDGGTSWTRQFVNGDPDAFYDCLAFFDDRTGVAYGDASGGRTNILRTTDGGATWALLPAAAVPAPLEGEGAFAASGGCVTAIDARHGFIALGGPGARFLRSDDAGATWSVHETPIVRGASAGLSAAAFRDEDHGIAVGGDMADYRRDTSAAAVAVTDDGGRSWSLRERPGRPGTPFGVTWVPGAGRATALVASPGGLHLTRDGGRSWQTLDERNLWSVGASGRTAWAVGVGGLILRVDVAD